MFEHVSLGVLQGLVVVDLTSEPHSRNGYL